MVSFELLQRGILALCIVYPAVEKRQSRIRLTVTSLHTDEQIEDLIGAMGGIAFGEDFCRCRADSLTEERTHASSGAARLGLHFKLLYKPVCRDRLTTPVTPFLTPSTPEMGEMTPYSALQGTSR